MDSKKIKKILLSLNLTMGTVVTVGFVLFGIGGPGQQLRFENIPSSVALFPSPNEPAALATLTADQEQNAAKLFNDNMSIIKTSYEIIVKDDKLNKNGFLSNGGNVPNLAKSEITKISSAINLITSYQDNTILDGGGFTATQIKANLSTYLDSQLASILNKIRGIVKVDFQTKKIENTYEKNIMDNKSFAIAGISLFSIGSVLLIASLGYTFYEKKKNQVK